MEAATHTCNHCGNQFNGNYCNVCGEKVYHDHHKTIGHLLKEVIHFITHFEGSFFMTLKTIFVSPGKLSAEYCKGIRKKYFKPISFFLLCVVLYLLFPKFEGLNMRLNVFVSPAYNFSRMALPVVKKKMAVLNVDYKTVAKQYDEKSPKISKIFLLILLPFMAATLYLLFFTKRKYFFDHFIFATEFGSFWIMVKFLLLPAIMILAGFISPSFINFFEDSNRILWLGLDLIFLVFLVAAFKRFYTQNWFWTILKAILFFFIFGQLIMQVYHTFLFLITMLFI